LEEGAEIVLVLSTQVKVIWAKPPNQLRVWLKARGLAWIAQLLVPSAARGGSIAPHLEGLQDMSARADILKRRIRAQEGGAPAAESRTPATKEAAASKKFANKAPARNATESTADLEDDVCTEVAFPSLPLENRRRNQVQLFARSLHWLTQLGVSKSVSVFCGLLLAGPSGNRLEARDGG
jgi:hypothetical protein